MMVYVWGSMPEPSYTRSVNVISVISTVFIIVVAFIAQDSMPDLRELFQEPMFHPIHQASVFTM